MKKKSPQQKKEQTKKSPQQKKEQTKNKPLKKPLKNPQKIKAIIFDIGGVLALPKIPANLIQNNKLLNGHRKFGVHDYISKTLKIFLDQWFDAIDTTYAKSIEGKISYKAVTKIISKNVGVSPRKLEKIIIRAYKNNFTQNKELYKTAFKLKKQGYKIAILSDQWPLSKKALVPKKYSRKFNVVVISCDVGMRKPDPRIYKWTLKKLNLPAKECLFIDNQKWNTKPAKKLKLNTILYKNNKQLFKELKKYKIKI